MVTKKKRTTDREFLARLGERVERIILKDLGYTSLDAFSLEHHDLIAKGTLYEICQGKRDMKLVTLRRLAESLKLSLTDLVKDE